MPKLKAVIFDIDGTLTEQNSWTAFTRDIGGSVAHHLAIYHDHIEGRIGLDESKRKLLKMWQATGKANKQQIEKTFSGWPIKPEARVLIDWLKKEGYIVCLITGSVGMYAKNVADQLGIDDYFSNAELYFDEGEELINFHYTANQAEVKLEQFKNFCKTKGLRAEECVAVGDDDNDIELFRHTGRGILVEGEKVADELRQAAWKTINTLSEVKDLLINFSLLL